MSSTLSSRAKVLASAVVVATAAGVAGLGTFGSFTSSTSASTQVGSGTVEIALGASGTANQITVNASGLVPGDTVQRAFTLSNTGNQNLSAITLTTTAPTSSLLDTDATSGLQIKVEKCSTGWTESGNGATTPFTYTCSGTTSTVLASRPVVGANLALSNLAATTAGSTDDLRATITLPSTAGNSFQDKTSTIAFAFTGTQRTATSK